MWGPRYTVLRVPARAQGRPFFFIYLHTLGNINIYGYGNSNEKFLEAKSVALIGVSPRAGENEFNILENLLDYDYQGGFTL
jgi:hypothetical protein